MLDNSTPKPPACKGSPAKCPAGKPKKPYKDFPLCPHPSGKWQKKIRGKVHYFGAWAKRVNGQLVRVEGDGWEEALAIYKNQADDLHAGRVPRDKSGETTLGFLTNHFLTNKLLRLGLAKDDIQKLADMPPAQWLPFLVEKAPAGKRMSPRMVLEYKQTTDRLIAKFRKNRLVSDLSPDDFSELENELAAQYGPVRRGNEIQKVRTLFKHAYEFGLIKAPMRYGPGFKKPDKTELRKHRAQKGPKMLEPDQLAQLIDAADVQLKAMIFLGINAALGNHDIALLTYPVLDLENGWLDYPRPKNGLARRCSLWPETVSALCAAIASRPEPRQDDAKGKVFVTVRGRAWLVRGIANPVCVAFRNLLKAAGLHRAGIGFYMLRHTFRTVADATLDFTAVRLVMGHVDDSIDDAYRERIDDARLVAVAQYVPSYCQVLCSEKSESGGIFLQHSIYEFPSLEKKNQLLRSVEPAPALFRCLGQFEHHGQAGFPGAVAFRTAVT